MAELTSYLLAQARKQPFATARFSASELWRRGRLRSVASLEKRLPEFPDSAGSLPWHFFVPAEAANGDAFRAASPQAADAILERSRRVLRHEICIFGEDVLLGKHLNWHRDWLTGHQWPVDSPGKVKILGAPRGADIKRPWELSRFHHFLQLGKAFLLSKDPRLVEEFVLQTRGWTLANPFPRGIHWAMPMEAAIRSINLSAAAAFFVNAPVPGGFWASFLRTLFLHGRYLYAHREWNPVARSNHFLACAVGLVHLGALFQDQPEGRRWLKFGRSALAAEMTAQVGEEGVAHEGSIGYHAFVTELFFSGALVLARVEGRANGSPVHSRKGLCRAVGDAYVNRLEKMLEFLSAAGTGRERTPIIGDSDDGRVLPYCPHDADHSSHLLSLGETVLQRRFAMTSPHACEESWWQCGAFNSVARRQDLAVAQSVSFGESGFHFFSSRRISGSIRCGPVAVLGWGNHGHCDQLSVEFCWKGRPLIQDPGTYLYSGDSDARNHFRSTRAHNSVVVEDQEQNRFWPRLLFRILDDTQSRTTSWQVTDQRVYFSGEHSGYRRLTKKVIVHRRIALDRAQDTLVICDTLQGRGSAQLEWNFQLAPDVFPSAVRVAHETGAILRAQRAAWLEALVPHTGHLDLRWAWRIGPMYLLALAAPTAGQFDCLQENSSVSPRYGKRERAPIIRFRCVEKFPARVVFVFVAADDSKISELVQP